MQDEVKSTEQTNKKILVIIWGKVLMTYRQMEIIIGSLFKMSMILITANTEKLKTLKFCINFDQH